MSYKAQTLLGVPWRPILVDGVDFDGTTSMYGTRGAALTGSSNARSGILSAWIRIDGGDASQMQMFASDWASSTAGQAAFRFYRTTDNKLAIRISDANGITAMWLQSANQHLTTPAIKHVLAAWNLASSTGWALYVNGAADPSTSLLSYTTAALHYGSTDWAIAAGWHATTRAFGLHFNGALSELYFAPGQYLDIGQSTNRALFRTALGTPADLGQNGEYPTGSTPLAYMGLRKGSSLEAFVQNRGSGGAFTFTGSPTRSTASPSD